MSRFRSDRLSQFVALDTAWERTLWDVMDVDVDAELGVGGGGELFAADAACPRSC